MGTKITISERRDLMAKWATKENEEIGLSPYVLTIGSGERAYWRCVEQGHLYKRVIDKEVRRKPKCHDCKMATKERISERPDLMTKWATKENEEIGLFPYDLRINSTKNAYWRCEEHRHLYERNIDKEVRRKSKCTVCRQLDQKYLSDYPELVEEFAFDINKVTPEEITAGNDVSIAWCCKKCENVWNTATYHRIKDKSGCPYCSNKKVLKGFNDLATIKSPNFKYWNFDKNNNDGILAQNYTPMSGKEAWWFCDKGHSTYEVIKKVIGRKKNHCSECIRLEKEEYSKRREEKQKKAKIRIEKAKIKERKIKERKNNALSATLLKFWDHEENSKRGFELESAKTRRVYNFKCIKGHKWKSDLEYLSNNSECPECFIEMNSIASKYPYLTEIFDIDRNGGISPEKCLAFEAKYYWWTCRKGHSFVARLINVAQHKETGCMYCDKEKSYYSL